MRLTDLLAGTALATTVTFLLPGAAEATPVGTIQIDESVEGQLPTVTADTTSGLTAGTVTPVVNTSGLEEWHITFSGPGNESVGGGEGGLYEPGTNQTQLSDRLSTFGSPTISNGIITVTLDLLSDSDTQGIIASICAPPISATCLPENGDFQRLFGFQFGFANTGVELGVNVELKSELDPVPEPGSLAILASGLLGLGLLRRRRIPCH